MRPVQTTPSPRRTVARTGSLIEGLLAGLALALFDGLAAGVGRVPAALVVVLLVWGLLCGLLAGFVGLLAGRRGVALGLIVAGGTLLHAGSTYTKSLGPPAASAWSLLALLCLVLLALAAGVLAASGLARRRGLAWPALVIAAVPGASLAWSAVPSTPLALCLTCSLPLVVALVWRLALPAWTGAVGVCAALVALTLPSIVADARRLEHRPPPPSSVQAPAGAPDILLVIVDTLRYDHAFPAPPQPALPVLSELASEGARFDQAISSAPWTLPSIGSLLTSLHPSQHGAVLGDRRLPGDIDTLPELLHAAGYETVAFTGGGFLRPAFGLDQGFERFDPEAEFHFLPFRGHIPLVWRLIKNRWVPLRFVLRWVTEYGGLRTLRGRVSAWLDGRDSNRPFFLLVHTYQVHDYNIYEPEADDPVLAEHGGPPACVGERLLMPSRELRAATQDQLDWYHELYRGRVAYVDAQLGPLLARVERGAGGRGLVTVFAADHGEGFDAGRHRVHHGLRLHDDLLRVPLVLRAPGRVAPGQVIGDQVRLVDVMPTLLDLAGVPVPDGLVGRSLMPLLAGDDDAPRAAWSEVMNAYRLVSLRTPEYKLVDLGVDEQVFRLDRDPLEDHPLEEEPPAELRALWDAREELLAPRGAAASSQDAATLDQLRRLGY